MRLNLSRRAPLTAAVLAAALMAGCATQTTPPLYYWGGYQAQLYGHFQNTKSPEEQIQALEEIREKARAKGLPLPPGLQAHLALLYGNTGQSERFMQNLQAEKQQFPESTSFIDFLLKKFENKPATEKRP